MMNLQKGFDNDILNKIINGNNLVKLPVVIQFIKSSKFVLSVLY